MTGAGKGRLRWYDACFADPGEEAAYRQADLDATLLYARIALLLALSLFGLFAAVDLLYGADGRTRLLIARSLICGCFILLLLLTWHPAIRRPDRAVWHSQAAACAIALGFSLLVGLADEPLRGFYVPGILLVVVALFVLLRLTLPEIAWIAVPLVCIYDAVWLQVWIMPEEFGAFVVMQFYLFAAVIVGGFSNYAIAHHRRVTHAAAGGLRAQAAHLQQALQQAAMARQQAEYASRAKSDFIAHMSHELRTPLNAVIGFGQVLEGEVYGPLGGDKYREYARHIHESGQHLLSLINDILDLSKVEAGQFELHRELIDIAAAMRAASLLVSGLTYKRQVKLRLAVPPELPLLQADERALKQIFVNLLSNAAKFSPAGGEVLFTAEVQPRAVAFIIADTGPGMDAEQVARALVPFGQASGHIAEATRGTGLGLPLAQRFTDLHGGTLVIDSRPGQGTRVTVTLPLN
ncbi:sensor histidine kinase [Ferrovibrio sp.]|uniref:sensor histidine kinase n=1 Tax=Ferrovibrio sp. TaxID=1917215 RepID=UPI003D0CEBF5